MRYEIPTLIISAWCLFEVIIQFSMRGLKEIWEERSILYFEAIISLLYWTWGIAEFTIRKDNVVERRFEAMNTIFYMRNFRALEFMAELEDYQMIVATTTNMTRPILVKMVFLYVIYFLYAVIG